MSRTLLDLKNFNHESTDENSTTLIHKKDGHKIILAHKSLSPKVQEQLKALCSGGEVKKPVKMADGGGISSEAANNNYQNVMAEQNAENAIQKVTEFDPNDVPAIDPNKRFNDEVNNLKSTFPNQPDEVIRRTALKNIESEEASKDQTKANIDAEKASEAKVKAEDEALKAESIKAEDAKRAKLGINPVEQNVATGRDAAAKYFTNDQSASLPNDPVQSGTFGQAVSGTGEAGAAENPDQFSNPEAMLKSGYQNQLQGIEQGAQAQGDLGAKQAEILNQQVKAEQDAKIAYQQHFNELDKERQAHISDIKNGYINPDKYWTGYTLPNGEKVSGHSKVMAGIGMILAGFNPTGRPNAAVDFLKDQMDRNLQAQARNLQAGDSLLAHNLQQFGNIKDAADMTRLMQADVTQNYLLSASATAQSPVAKAAALQAAGKLQQDFAPLAQQFAMRRAMMNLANDPNKDPGAIDHLLGYMRVMNPEMAKEMESRYIPGAGLASVPVPAQAREEMISKQKLQDAGQDLLNYSKTHSNVVPGTPEYNFGVSKSMAFQQMVREGLLGTVFRESEKPLLEKFVNENPAGAFKMFSTQPRIKAILDSNKMGLDSVKRGYGLPVKVEPQYKYKDGIKYMRGPKGEAIPVK